MDLYTTSPELDNAVVDPANWADEAGIHRQLTWLRQNDPLRWLEPEGFDPFWNVTKYDDIKHIEGNKRIFINDPRPILGPVMMQQMVEAMTGRKHLVRSLVQMDDPDHTRYRMLTQSWFMGTSLRKLQPRVEALAAMYVDRLGDLGGECDFVKDVAIWYPLRVIMTILGVPEEDEPLMLKLTQELFGGSDPDIQRSFEPADFLNVVTDFEAYFAELTRARREHPTDDVASLIANATFDG
jgi:cytochrome P450